MEYKQQLLTVGKTQAVNYHWTGLLKWTAGMGYWADLFFVLKILFMAYNKTPLSVKLHPALDQLVIATIIYLTALNHTHLKYGKQQVKMMSVLYCYMRRLHVSNLCEGSSMNSFIPKPLGRG